SDTLGRSGRDMLQAMIEGETGAEKLADLARGVLRKKLQQLQAALEGRIREHHRVMLKHLLEQWEFLEGKIGEVEEEIRTQMLPFQEAIAHLDSIPGVNETVAWTLVAELGGDYFERQDPQRTTRRLVRRLERLGHHVILQPATEAVH